MKWKAVPGYEGRYEISDEGEIRSLRVNGCARKKPRLMKKSTLAGYYMILLTNGDTAEWFRVNRLVLTTFVGKPPKGRMHAAHLDGNKTNNKVSNLVWATPKENNSHKIAHGTLLYGEAHPTAKLTNKNILEIRAAFVRTGRAKSNSKELAAKYGVTFRTVNAIARGDYKRVIMKEIKKDGAAVMRFLKGET